MIIGIDASNIRGGGGVTHLVELLAVADPNTHNFDQIIVWSGSKTLARIEPRSWLVKVFVPDLDRSLFHRVIWQTVKLNKLAQQVYCDLLFVPGGFTLSRFRPIVTMAQNQLLFDFKELFRYGVSTTTIRLLLLRYLQLRTFRIAEGIIFLTTYTKNCVNAVLGQSLMAEKVIAHGLNPVFLAPISHNRNGYLPFSSENPCRLLYISIVDLYKHQWNVVDAVAQLHTEGFPIRLHLVGPQGPGSDRLQITMKRADPTGSYIFYHGEIAYREQLEMYSKADIVVFASTCEAFSLILLEAMGSGRPIACSGSRPMDSIVGEGALLFDAEQPKDLVRVLRDLINRPQLRSKLVQKAHETVKKYTWPNCADSTFEFFHEIARRYKGRTDRA